MNKRKVACQEFYMNKGSRELVWKPTITAIDITIIISIIRSIIITDILIIIPGIMLIAIVVFNV